MKTRTEITLVNGGLVKRDALTGRFIEVRTSKGVARAGEKTCSAVGEVSSKRNSALKRLADR